ncbi:TIM barrel protein, partial [Candidatus Uhrbacteria bacterium]|nr:TIM barrel protein [Candidatus Uhrbacteria bacterium]
MRLSVAVAGNDAPASAFVVWRGFETSIEKAADLGYHGVELALKNADEIEPRKLDQWLASRDLEVSCISTGQVYAVSGLYFTHPDADARAKVLEVFRGLVDLAQDHGGLINVGRARGYYQEGQTPEEVEQLFIDQARRICDMGASKGVTLMIEPVNRYEINFVNSVDDAAALLSRVERENVGIMPDTFHMNIEDAHIGDALYRNIDKVCYVHFADSNRLAPGQAHLD